MSAPYFALVDPFDVDHGELNGLSPIEVFALGVEWALFRSRMLSEADRFKWTIRANNAVRIMRMLQRNNRVGFARQLEDGWMEVVVEPRVYS